MSAKLISREITRNFPQRIATFGYAPYPVAAELLISLG
jgi:hypothetical protein